MKYKNWFVLLFISLFLIVASSMVSALYDWKMYGNEFNPKWNEQLQGGYGRFDLNNSINSTNLSQTYSPQPTFFQPLVSPMGLNDNDSGLQSYLIFPNSHFLQIYDKNFLFFDEIDAGGNVNSQITTMDWNNDGKSDDVVGIWDVGVSANSTLEAFHFNTATNRYSVLSQYNFNTSNDNFTKVYGMRSSGNKAYMIAKDTSNKIYLITAQMNGTSAIINKTYINDASFNQTFFTEPLGFFDIDSDGLKEFYYWDATRVVVFDENGNVILHKTYASPYVILDANFVQSGANQWKIAILYQTGSFGQINLDLIRQGGTTFWTSTIVPSNINIFTDSCKMAVADDYDGDLTDNEIYVACEQGISAVGQHHYFEIIKGFDGSKLVNFDSGVLGGTPATTPTLTLADMNHDGKNDFIVSWFVGTSQLEVFNPVTQHYLFHYDFGSVGTPNCIPADLNVDGKQEIICQTNAKTFLFFVGNLINQPPTLNTVTYDPSTTVQLGTTLYIEASATDPEADPIYYSFKCQDSDNWSSDSISTIFPCNYATVGEYLTSVRVRDLYHSTYNSTFNQTVFVTATGTSCNNNGICESNLGETTSSCPNDCPASSSTTTQALGGVSVPTKLVDVQAFEQGRDEGLLPEVYFGILGIFSYILQPLIILFVVFALVLFVLAIAGFLKMIFHKVGGG